MRRRGITLLETLVTVAIIAIVLAVLMPAIGGVMTRARAFVCQANQRTIAFDFTMFIDDQMHGDRGDDERLAGSRFRLETFQESQYCVDEFWCLGDVDRVDREAGGTPDPMRCPEQRGTVTLARGLRCEGGAIGPPENVSFGFNIWLHRPEVRTAAGRIGAPQITLSEAMLARQPQSLPLFWDVDGERAREKGVQPVFSGPSLDSVVYANDAVWFPSDRHGARANFAFVDGHVDASDRPTEESEWAWTVDAAR